MAEVRGFDLLVLFIFFLVTKAVQDGCKKRVISNEGFSPIFPAMLGKLLV